MHELASYHCNRSLLYSVHCLPASQEYQIVEGMIHKTPWLPFCSIFLSTHDQHDLMTKQDNVEIKLTEPLAGHRSRKIKVPFW